MNDSCCFAYSQRSGLYQTSNSGVSSNKREHDPLSLNIIRPPLTCLVLELILDLCAKIRRSVIVLVNNEIISRPSLDDCSPGTPHNTPLLKINEL